MAKVLLAKARSLFTRLLLLSCFDCCLFARSGDSFVNQMQSKQSNNNNNNKALWSDISKQLIVDTSTPPKRTYSSSSSSSSLQTLKPSLKTSPSSSLSSSSSASSSLLSGNPLRPSSNGEHQEISFHGKSREEIKRLTSTPGALEQLRRLHAQQEQQQHQYQHQYQQQRHRFYPAAQQQRRLTERRPNLRRHHRKRQRLASKASLEKLTASAKAIDKNDARLHHPPPLTTPPLAVNANHNGHIDNNDHNNYPPSSLPFPFPGARGTKPSAGFDHTPVHPLYTHPRSENQIHDHGGIGGGMGAGSASSSHPSDLLSHASVIYSNPAHRRKVVPPPSNNCCIRKIKFQNIGYDTYGRPVEVDVGECSRQCPYKKTNGAAHHPGLSSFIPPPFMLGNGGNDNHGRYRRQAVDPLASSEDQPMCDAHSGCFPTRKKMERWHLLNGLVEAEVIDDCACSAPPDSCVRTPLIKIFHPNSPYETRVDVGKCGGSCYDSNTRCNAVANTTVSIDTPNGERSIPVVSQCGCTKTCFRASYKEVYYEAMYNKTSRQMERHVKEIDVGKCVGGCEGVKRQKCVLRDEKDPGICLMSLIKRQTSCIPTSYEKHEFLTPNMDLKTVVAIRNCGCK